jgi:ribose transport system substrate-binding protein
MNMKFSTKKGLWFLGLLISVMGLAFAGGGKDDGKLDVTFVNPYVGHPYWNKVDDGCKAAAAQYNIKLKITGPTSVDANEQIGYIETALSENVDGLVTMALNPASFTPVINKVMDAKIPVMLLDGDAPSSKRLAFYGSNNYNGGIECAKVIEQLTGGNAKIGIIAPIDIKHIMDRVDGIKDYIADKKDMEIVSIEDDRADVTATIEKTTAMLQAHPEINVVFGNGSHCGPGIAKAVEEMGLVGKVKLIAVDVTPQTADYIKAGVIDVALAQQPYQMGFLAVEALYKVIVNGEKITGEFDTGTAIVTKANVDEHVLK